MAVLHSTQHIHGQRPARRRRRRGTSSARFSWKSRLVLLAVAMGFLLPAVGVLARSTAPRSNTDKKRFDAIIVLGYPTDDDGNPTPTQLARVTEAVREYERGVAPRLILSGGAAHNQYVEAQGMARSAMAQGIPASAIVMEQQAMDTIQNACYSVRIMKAHGWKSAEVISSDAHLARAGLIFERLPLEWSTHAAPPLQPQSPAYVQAAAAVETAKTLRYLMWTRWIESCEP